MNEKLSMATAVENFERIEDVRDPEVATKLSDYTKSSGSSAENGKINVKSIHGVKR